MSRSIDPNPTVGLVPLERVRTKLAALWMVGGSLIVGILVVQSLLGRYGDKVQDVWGWLLPTLMPTLAMILAVLGYSALSRAMSGIVVRRDFFTVAFWLSGFYLFLIQKRP